MNNPKPKAPRGDESGPIAPMRPAPRASEAYVPWRTAQPRAGESVRWECVDGRWITIALGEGGHAGQALVCNAAGQCVYVDSYEEALALAKKWRTV